jgi:hypothetical protein
MNIWIIETLTFVGMLGCVAAVALISVAFGG